MRGLFVLAVAGCGAEPTYGEDIAPMVARSCLACHGAEAALPLTTYAEVRMAAPAALAAIRSGRMPAGNIDRSGSCGSFLGPEPVTEDDVQGLSDWVAAGLPAGPAAAPVAATAPFVADATLSVGPFDAKDEHRCFVVDGAFDPGFIDAFRVSASPAGALHHAMLFALPTAAVAEADAMDAIDAEAGWACEHGPGLDAATLAAVWTPGDPAVAFPRGTGMPVTGAFVVQLHVQETAPPGSSVEIGLRRVDQVEHPLSFVPVAATGLVLPAGRDEVRWSEPLWLAGPDLQVYGVVPHLHQRGKALSLSGPDGCIVDVPRWDYGWQEVAWFQHPFPLASGSPLTLSCDFSTRDAEVSTVWGEGADDEMCMVFLLAATR